MSASSDPRPESAAMHRTGLVLSGLVSLFLLVDGGARLAGFAPYVEGLTKFGYSPTLAPWIGLSLLVSTVLYVVPRTTVLGAILVTGYLGGGATATRMRLGDPWFLTGLRAGATKPPPRVAISRRRFTFPCVGRQPVHCRAARWDRAQDPRSRRST